MKYGYKELKGKCKTCIGCNKCEHIEFEGTYSCDNYVKGVEQCQTKT